MVVVGNEGNRSMRYLISIGIFLFIHRVQISAAYSKEVAKALSPHRLIMVGCRSF